MVAKDPYRFFRVEARQLLDSLGRSMLSLERGVGGSEQMALLLRLSHTLKGAARVVRQPEIADLAHAIEDALAPYRDGTTSPPRERVDHVLATLDTISHRVAQLPAPEGTASAPEPVALPAVFRADAGEVDGVLEGLTEVGRELASLHRAADAASRSRHVAALLLEQFAAVRHADSADPRSRGWSGRARSMADEINKLVGACERSIGATIERLERELRQVRDKTESLRLVPVAALFNALQRAARDAARLVGKDVVFEAKGGDIRLDGGVLEVVQSALVQLVRNAVAHGIEPVAERAAAGKPHEGRVEVRVARRGDRVAFTCTDDGRGLDVDAVRAEVRRKGLAAADADPMSDTGVFELLLKGGITTSARVTELSGRGVGLDVVRDAMQKLGGAVSVETGRNKGTSIQLEVPVSLAAVEVLGVEIDGQKVAIPLEAVKCALRVAPNEMARTPEGEGFLHDGRFVSLAPLKLRNGRRERQSRGKAAVSVVIVANDESMTAIAVERLAGKQTVMLRPLPPLAIADPIVAGVYLDAQGHPSIVLDADALLAPGLRPELTTDQAETALAPILIIDDSVTTRMLEQSILESAGYVVELAASAEEGLELARRASYALFLVDVEMPGMDGFSFVERTRADPELRGTPCILVTSRDSAEDRRRGEQAGASAYIVKTAFDQIEFLDRIARLVRA